MGWRLRLWIQNPLDMSVTYRSIYIYIYIYMGIHALCIPIKPCNQHPNWNNCANLQPRHPNKVKFTIYVTCTFQTQRFSCAWLGELKVQLGHPIKVCGGDE